MYVANNGAVTVYRNVSKRPRGGRSRKAYRALAQHGIIRLPTPWIGKRVKVILERN